MPNPRQSFKEPYGAHKLWRPGEVRRQLGGISSDTLARIRHELHRLTIQVNPNDPQHLTTLYPIPYITRLSAFVHAVDDQDSLRPPRPILGLAQEFADRVPLSVIIDAEAGYEHALASHLVPYKDNSALISVHGIASMLGYQEPRVREWSMGENSVLKIVHEGSDGPLFSERSFRELAVWRAPESIPPESLITAQPS